MLQIFRRVTLCSLLMTGCSNIFGQDYAPLKEGLFWIYRLPRDSLYVEILDNKYYFEGYEYYTTVRDYSWGLSDTSYSRIDDNGNQLYLDTKSWTESISIPNHFSVGQTWISIDGIWEHQIYSENDRLVTPETVYEDCLVIKATQLKRKDRRKYKTYLNYFVKGIGLVGSKSKNRLILYLIDYGSN